MTRPRRNLLRNASLAISTACAHLLEDPLLFMLQVGRRAPKTLRQRLGSRLGNGSGLAAATALWWEDRPTQAVQILAALPLQRRRLRTRWAAELAVALGRSDLASQLTSTAGTFQARLAWARGELTRASSLAAGTRSAVALGRRYRSDLAVLDGTAAPQLPRRNWSAPTPDTPRALHVLTNSLPHTTSGYTRRTHAVLRAQRDAGIKVAAFTRLAYPVSVGKLGASDRDVRDGVRYFRVLPWRQPRTSPQRLQLQAETIAVRAAPFAPTVIHATTDHTNALVARALADHFRCPWVYEVRGLLEESWVARQPLGEAQRRAEKSERRQLWQDRETAMMLEADHVVTLGATLATELRSRGVEPAKLTVIPNCVDDSFLKVAPRPDQAREHLGLASAGFWVGTVSSLVDYEGLDTMLDAVALLRAQAVDARALIVGDGVARASLEQHAAALGISESVVFTGAVPSESAVSYHHALDVFAVPRRDVRVCRLVTPLKPVEAMACGRPVIASDLPALTELVSPSTDQDAAIGPQRRTGLLAKAQDAESWANGLATLEADSGLRQQLGQAGREFAATRTWRQAGDTYRAIYEGLVA